MDVLGRPEPGFVGGEVGVGHHPVDEPVRLDVEPLLRFVDRLELAPDQTFPADVLRVQQDLCLVRVEDPEVV